MAVDDERGDERAQELEEDVPGDLGPRESPPDGECDGDGRVEVASAGHGTDGDGKGDAHSVTEADTTQQVREKKMWG